jgi:putative tricarboxylic transport membrane protein
LLVRDAPDVFWGVIASMYLGNIMLLVLNLPLIGLWVKVLKVPYPILFPLILLFCLIGSYSVNNAAGEVLIMIISGVFGYLMKKFKYEGAPFILALVLGPMFENAFRQSLLLSNGSLSIFIKRPIPAVFLSVTVVMLILAIIAKRTPGEKFKDV